MNASPDFKFIRTIKTTLYNDFSEIANKVFAEFPQYSHGIVSLITAEEKQTPPDIILKVYFTIDEKCHVIKYIESSKDFYHMPTKCFIAEKIKKDYEDSL